MSKYDLLNASTELEQAITADLKAALEKRGCTVRHNGSATGHAAAGLPDIVVTHRNFVLTVEVTKSRGAQQDRELNSIRDHLQAIKTQNPNKTCFCLYCAPQTPLRMRDGIRDYNRQRAAERHTDLQIMPLCFETLELLTSRWIRSEAVLYPLSGFIRLFNKYNEFVDDLRVRKLLVHSLFPNDITLSEEIEAHERETDNKTLEQLIKDLANLEDVMRQNGIATAGATIDNLIFLVFLKVFEEKRERDHGRHNRLRSAEAFLEYRDNLQQSIIESKRGIHELFASVKADREFTASRMFTPNDSLTDSLNDDFVIERFIPKLAPYTFIGTRVDALGAVYEVLAQRAQKDVKVGQFFTPENVVDFMVRLASLRTDDRVLDPACGTDRFLIFAMHNMLEKLRRSSERNKSNKEESIRQAQLFGADIDERIAKIAKMNMWIHGDGKSNIFGGQNFSGLTLHKHSTPHFDTFDNAFDVILANPPLGDLNYQAIDVIRAPDSSLTPAQKVDLTLDRIPILPHRNRLEDRVRELQRRLEGHENDLRQMQEAGVTGARINSKRRTIEDNRLQITDLEALLRAGNKNFEITGNTLKGGALFLTAMWHYLKADAYPDEFPEWRGGRLLVILDEGILNTDEYQATRAFLQERFYIKAIISLTRDTFVPISKTATKTSIFFAVKKTDFVAEQQEPIFYGHVAYTGLDTKGKATHNDFEDILARYGMFERAVREGYTGLEFRPERFQSQEFESGYITAEPDFVDSDLIGSQDAKSEDKTGTVLGLPTPKKISFFFKTGEEKPSLAFAVNPREVAGRLHYLFYHPRYRALDELQRRFTTTTLSQIVADPIRRGEQPEYDENGEILVIKTVDLKNGSIALDEALRVSADFYESKPQAHIKSGDVLLASTGYVSMGKVDVYTADVPAMADGHVAIIRVSNEYDPCFIAYYLRSFLGQLQIEKWFTGSSGQIELQPSDVGQIIIPVAGAGGVPLPLQRIIADAVTKHLEAARMLEVEAALKWSEARRTFEQMLLSAH